LEFLTERELDDWRQFQDVQRGYEQKKMAEEEKLREQND
jgi:hypothetical protein